MVPDGMLGRKRFWAGVLCALLGAGSLYLGRDFQLGTLRAPGPGAFPLALAAAVALFGAIVMLRAMAASPRMERAEPIWPSPLAIAATVVALAAAALAFFGPVSPHFAGLGAGTTIAWYVLVLAAAAAAAALLPGGTPGRALGAVLVGLLLGTSGIDPLTPNLERYASVEANAYFNFVHGLVLALVAYHVGFNALLIAAAVALSPKIETALRQGLAGADGNLLALFDQSASLALLAAAVAALALAAWPRPRPAAYAPPPARTITLPRDSALAASPGALAGAAALALGALGLYFGAGIGTSGASDLPGMFGPGTAPMALSAALALLGVLLFVFAFLQPAFDRPVPPFARAPATIGAAAILTFLVLALVVAPVVLVATGQLPVDLMLRFGPPEIAALILLIVTLCAAAAWLLPRGSFLRAMGALAIGLLASTIGLDPVTGVIRYTHELQVEAVHGLVLGFAAYRLGFNPLLIAVGFLYGERLENAVRQTLIMTQGDVTALSSRTMAVTLLAAALGVLAAAALLRLWQRRLVRAGAASPHR